MDEVGVTIADISLISAVATGNGRGANNPNNADRESAREQAMAIRFIRGTNAGYKSYLTHLRNSFLDGNDNYPTTLHGAYNILQRREADVSTYQVGNDGMAFVNSGDDRNLEHITCFQCGLTGHYANRCPKRQQPPTDQQDGTVGCTNGIMSDNVGGFTFSQVSKRIPDTWILLDNQSTIDLFCNEELVKNIRESNTTMNVHCNAGARSTNLIADVPGYGWVWFDRKAIANIFSLKNVSKKYHVAFDSGEQGVFVVTKPDRTVFEFVESDTGLYYMDADDKHEKKKNGVTMTNVDTVTANKSNYTNEDYLKAVRAREIQVKIGRPSLKDYVRIITSNLLPNSPVTKADIMAAEHIFGPDVGSLKGKTVRRRPPQVKDVVEPLPPSIMERYRNITLCADIMYVNGIAMLVTVSRNIRFATVEALSNRKAPTIEKAIKAVKSVYLRSGFKITTALMDGEFETLRENLLDMRIQLNTTGRDEHVGDIERFIRTIKERIRSTYNTLPFKRVPPRLVIEMAKSSVYWLNAFPHTKGVSDTMSPRTIVAGVGIDFNRHCKYQFGQYVQTHEEHDNSMAPRTIGALATRPTGNAQGSYYFFSLSTGRIVNRTHATPLPMPEDVIDRVHAIARRQKSNPGLIFADRNQVVDPLNDDGDDEDDSSYQPNDSEDDDDLDEEDSDDDSSYHPDDDDDDDDDDDGDNYIDGNQEADEDAANSGDNDDDTGRGTGVPPENDIAPDAESAGVPNYEDEDEFPDAVSAGVPNDRELPDAESTGMTNDGELPDEESTGVPNEGNEVSIDHAMNARYGARTQSYGMRVRRERDYSHLFHQVGILFSSVGVADSEDTPLATPQMSMKKGLKTFGKAGVEAVRKEMKQLHDRKVMVPCKPKELTREQKKEALAYLMFLKRKRCGKVKGRGCADGRKQRAYTAKEDASSPTVSTEAVFLTAVIDAMENRVVAVIDVPGAFMQADMDELVHVRFTGKMVDLLLDIDKAMHKHCVTYERGERVMYVELLKALYGTIRAARLFWDKLSSKLQEWGFTPNPYDSCVVNKMVDGKQLTVAWHVDDLKVSHVSTSVVDQFIAQMNEEFGKETPLNESRGKVHDYLGMILDFSNPGTVIVSMINYVKMVLHDTPRDMEGTAVNPAAKHLFTINSTDAVLLTQDRKDVFVRITMQLLYLSQRARPDIRTAISFLCGRLNVADEDDYRKLTRVIKYLRDTVDLELRLGADESGEIQWWVDASFAIHSDMKGHTGGTMSMGSGSIFSTSNKQRLVSRSSTESEVIGVHDVLPQMVWTRYFLIEQGFNVKDMVLHQDNTSSILLETNGKRSSTKRTRHMNIRYFFIKDRVDAKEFTIKHCPTLDMVADYFTKPLQGSLFRKLRDLVMNVDPSSKYHSGHRSVLRVEVNSDVVSKDTDDVANTRSYKDTLMGVAATG
jgi:hypothetical protein